MNHRSLPAILAVLVLASCATEKPEPRQNFDTRAVNIHLQDLVYDSSVFRSSISCIRDDRLAAAINRLQLAQDTVILRMDELIPYSDSDTQRQVIKELQSIKKARKLNPPPPFVGSGQPYDSDISNIINRAEWVLKRVP